MTEMTTEHTKTPKRANNTVYNEIDNTVGSEPFLVKELEQDIKQFGDFDVLAIFEFVKGAKHYIDYLFRGDSHVFTRATNFEEQADVISAKKLLSTLKHQNLNALA
ncbi:hypothetical protein [Bavariicoccus seileri]|uniref:hypothetical protein n=1 Tax=Bavariicoccus seileri TaxID=549685 RepID=UPI003F938171